MRFFALNITLAAACAITLAAAPLPALANGTMGNDYEVTIHNNSNRTIDGIYATNVDNGDWGDNLIDGGLLPGDEITVDTDDYSGYCIFDLRATAPKGRAWRWNQVNVCEQGDLYVR
jgi:hypothetical protein